MEYSFGKIQTVLEAPKLTEIQRKAYESFLTSKIGEILQEVSPVRDYNDNLHLYFDNYRLIEPSSTAKECIEKNLTYAARLMVTCRLENKRTKEIRESEVCFGEIPVMTKDDIFILNGITKVIVSQLVRSPGIYYTLSKKSSTHNIVEGVLIPHQGAWLELQNDNNDVIFVKMNKQKRILITPFLRVLGLSEDEIKELLTDKYYQNAMKKDKFAEYSESLKEVFVKTKPGEPFSQETAKNIISYLYSSPERYVLKEVGRYKLNAKTGLNIPLDVSVLTKEDIIEYIRGYIRVLDKQQGYDDIDHLSNRRVKTVGELAEEKFRTGLAKTIRAIKEQISVKGSDDATPKTFINPRPLQNSLKEFFMMDQLSQMLESTNGLSEITNKRRVSAIGKGGVNKDRAGMEVRDVHYSHYGRLCHIETPDGANIGLITSLAVYADLDKYGFLTTPYRRIDKVNKKILNQVDYINAEEEENFYVAQIDINVDENGNILDDYVRARHRGETLMVPVDKVDYMDVSPLQTISVSASLVTFLHNDDATRAGMGCNMQRQAVPLIVPESPLVGTGAEKMVGAEYTCYSDVNGEVIYVDCDRIDIRTTDDIKTYELINFFGTKKHTCIRETPVVEIGDIVKVGDPLYYKYCLDRDNGKLALGKNIIVAYMPWEGYNYEDSILISEDLVNNDVFTSLHIEKHEVQARDTKLGPEEFTNDLMDISTAQKQKLDDNGFIHIGTKIKAGDILVGKITPKGEKELTPEERILKAIFGSKAGEFRNTSEKVSNGDWGTVIKVDKYTKEDNIDLGAGVNELVQITTAKKRKIQVGDKMAGRHGNKGVVSRVLPRWEMPYLPDGTPVQILLNPMGVPSRMNIGQVLETHLGLAAKKLNLEYIIPPFDGPSTEDIKAELRKAGLPENGKTILYDGRTGKPFDNEVTVGVKYMLRLSHLVDEKYHARSTGSYSLITQQPLGGKAQFGGQRFGEMEVWALEAYGAAHTLQEMLTIKSDDVIGRDETTKAILNGEEPPAPRLPESFKVLDRQLNALCLKACINGRDDITQSSEDDLKEKRFLLDEEISKIVKPWKPRRATGNTESESDDYDDDYEEYDDSEEVVSDEVDSADILDNSENTTVTYLDNDEILDVE